MKFEIAITGLGLTTSLGRGKSHNWRRLIRGESGIAPIKSLDVSNYPVKDAGEDPEGPEVDAVDATGISNPEDSTAPELRLLEEVCQEALVDATSLDDGDSSLIGRPERIGLTIGSSLAASHASQFFFQSYLEKGPEGADYEMLRGYYVEHHIKYLMDQLGIRGPSLLVSNACAAGGSSIARAGDWIRNGRCDVVVASGFDAFSIFTFAGFGSLMALSSDKMRPFSARRDGMKLGGGYAALILEPLDRALDRGKKPLAILSGYGESSDAHHLTHPHPEGHGAVLAMQRALAMANLSPGNVDAVNCHATATPANDAVESRAMKEIFGERMASLPLFASKPAVGHTLGGAGAVEAAIATFSLLTQKIPPTLNAEETDSELGDLHLVDKVLEADLRHVMSNSFGFGGSNVSLLISTFVESGNLGGVDSGD